MSNKKDAYEVGYGKPPKHTRWTKGQSGNPCGRELGHKGLKTDLETALNAVQTIENKLTGKQVKGRNQWHAILRLVERAALGDLKAQALLFPMVVQVLGTEDRNKGPKQLSALDQAILDDLLTQRMTEVTGEPAADGGNGNRMLPPPDGDADDYEHDEEENQEGEDGFPDDEEDGDEA